MVTKMTQHSQATKSGVKIHAFLAHAGLASRREAEKLIEQGLVSVNGQRAEIGQRINPGHDKVVFRGQPVGATENFRYFLVNKPVEVVSTTSDELGRQTVLDLLPANLKTVRLYPVGRLDHDSQGLMLITNDGNLAHRLTHPSFKINKLYYAQLELVPTDKALDHLRRGVKLKDGFTQPVEVELLPERGDRWVSIQLHEGRNRQVRRMMERVGYEVTHLIRVTFGPFSLKDLHGKPYLELTAEQLKPIRQSVGL
jgi:23S rRNA pseudouridine2605 synthase